MLLHFEALENIRPQSLRIAFRKSDARNEVESKLAKL
jgi:hypothetical protein